MRKSLRLLLSLIILFLFPLYALSQQSVDVSYNYGSIVVHSPEIEPISLNPVQGFSLNYSFKNKNGEGWRRYYNYPNFGLNYNYKSYNNPDVLGDSHALTSFIQLSFLPKRKYFDIGFKGLVGVAYFAKTFDAVTNPTNQAISAHFNISGEVRLYTKIRFEPMFFEYSIGLNHASNGLMQSPNLGVNVLNNSFTLGLEFEDQVDRDELKKKDKPLFIKNEFWAFVSTGFKEVDYNSNKYVFTGLSLNYSKQLSVINKMGIGADFSYDPSLTSFAREYYFYEGDKDLGYRFGLNIHNEFIMGKTGLYAAYGLYLGDSQYYTRQRYYKAGFKFYFNNIIGVVLIRAVPLFRAEVVEFGVGYTFRDRKYRNSQ